MLSCDTAYTIVVSFPVQTYEYVVDYNMLVV